MVDLPPYAKRFEFGRLFFDAGRVLMRAGPLIVAGALVLGVVPVVIVSVPWWRSAPGAPPETVQVIIVSVKLAKLALQLSGYSLMEAFLAAVSLAVLTGESWRRLLAAPRLALGFATGLLLEVMLVWPQLVTVLSPAPYSLEMRWLLSLGAPLSALLLTVLIGIAPGIAIAERRSVLRALARSYQLLNGLRWRMLSLSFAYLLAQYLIEYSVAVALWRAGISYQNPGAGYAWITLSGLLVAVLCNPLYVSFYLQARRLAEGPTAAELHEVFA